MPLKTRTASSRNMEKEEIKQIVEEVIQGAVSNLVNVEYMNDLVSTLKSEIQESLTEKIKEATEPLEHEIVALKGKLDIFEAHMENLEGRIDRMETEFKEKIKIHEDVIEEQDVRLDDLEQYSRRACLRIFGIPVPSSRKVDDCLSKVKAMCKEIEVEIDDKDIDRAHRIGQTYQEHGITHQAIIVKFHSWGQRTAVYKARKKLSNGQSIRLDITNRRSTLLSLAKEQKADNPNIDFSFVDVNCRLGFKFQTGEFRFFNTVREMNNILDEMA